EGGDRVAVLWEIGGGRVEMGSVPGGYYARNVAEAAAECGIRTLFNSEPRISSHIVNGCLVLGRFTVQQGIPPQTIASVTAGKVGSRFRQFAYWNIKKIAKTAGGTYWLRMRKWVLDKEMQ